MPLENLQSNIRSCKNPMALSLELRGELIPPAYMEKTPIVSEAFAAYAKTLLTELRPVVPAVNFPTAFYEAQGAPGLAALQSLCAHARALDYFVILETMRCDFGPAAQALADAYFAEDGLYHADAVSLCGFSGSDGIAPFLPYCRMGKTVFILSKTPNKSARETQDLISGDRVIYTVMADLAMRWGGSILDKSGYSQMGISVGASHAAALCQLREAYDRLFFLVPGFGAAGCGAGEVCGAFDQFGYGALLSVGEPVLGAWRKREKDGVEAAAEAVQALKHSLRGFVTVI